MQLQIKLFNSSNDSDFSQSPLTAILDDNGFETGSFTTVVLRDGILGDNSFAGAALLDFVRLAFSSNRSSPKIAC